MGRLKENDYTLEFNEVMEYMSSTLFNEFPTDVLSLEYLILSILDNRSCHANMILDNCLMSNNIEELRKIYVSVLDKHTKPQLKGDNIVFNDDLVKMMDCCKAEADNLNTRPIGTEHILLAILNKKNNFKEAEVFGKFRLEYEFILNKCAITKSETDNAQKNKSDKLRTRKINKSKETNEIPLKSQINTKTISTKDSNNFISEYTTSLNKLAKEGKIDEIVGRQQEIEEIIKVLSRRKKNNAVLVGEGGCGKCLAKGTKVLMFDGTFKNVEDVKVGDKLMGIDSTPRNVIALGSGIDDMYTVHQRNGMSYTVNSEHILSLKGGNCNGLEINKIYDIPIKEYMSFNKTKKENLLGYKSGLIHFENNSELNIDPYFLGLWLGDGSSSYISITNIDEPIIDYVKEYADLNECKIRKEKITYNLVRKNRGTLIEIDGNGVKDVSTIKEISEKYKIPRSSINDVLSLKRRQTHGFLIKYVDNGKNPILEKFRSYNLINNKHIPVEYKTSSKENRLKLLAGIIDTDGYCNKYGYEISQKNKQLFDDIVFLCNSLGLNTRIEKEKIINGRTYYRLCVYGKLLTEIPVKLERKKISSLSPNKDSLKTEITNIEYIGKGEYYGFQIDGDKRFILEDFTVTHNTAIIYGIANMIESGNVPEVLVDKEIIMLNPMALVSGTHFRGMFEERINGLFNEIKKSNKYILFIDDIHTVLKSGSKEKDADISGMIGEALSEGSIKIIGTTTFKEYRNSIESNSSLSRKLQKIIIEPTSIDETIRILETNKKYYEDYHNVVYTKKSIEKAVCLADRFITDRALPDSAFDIIDLAGANTSLIDREPTEIQNIKKRIREIEEEKNVALNTGDFEKIDSLNAENNVLSADLADYRRSCGKDSINAITINENDISSIVSEITKIPVNKLSSSEKSKIAHIDEVLKQNIVGQDEAIESICKIIKRNKVGLGDKQGCQGVFLCVGRSGTGKTLLAKKLAEEIFGDEKSLIRLDMSEYSEKNSVSKLHGTSQGYIGYDDGGVLTEAIKRKPYSVVLLDEIEKADESIYNLFLQVFDEGRLSESNGNIVDCHNCIFIMTSNIGAKKSSELGNGVGFVTNEETTKKSIIDKELKRKFTPEFLNRINKIVYFNDLTNDNLKNIVKLEINKFNNRLNNIEYNIEYADDVVEYIHAEAVKKKELGARPIIRLIQTNIEDKITELMLENDYKPHYVFHASCEGDEIVIQ